MSDPTNINPIATATEAPVSEAETAVSRERDSLNARYTRASLVVNNARQVAAIRKVMEAFGYREAEYQEGARLLESCRVAMEVAARESGEASQAIQNRRDAEAQAEELTRIHLAVARIVFANDLAASKALILKGRRDLSIGGWIRENLQFYNNLLANPEWLAAMERRGQHQADLEEALRRVRKVEALLQIQGKETGESEHAIPVRNAALQELEAWASEYLQFAQIACFNQPQLLESLGVTVAS